MRSQMPAGMLMCTLELPGAYGAPGARLGTDVAARFVIGLTLAPVLPSTEVIG